MDSIVVQLLGTSRLTVKILLNSHRHTSDGAKCAEKCGKPRKSCGHACQLKWYCPLTPSKLIKVILPPHAMNQRPVKPASPSDVIVVSINRRYPVSQPPPTHLAVSKTSLARTSVRELNVTANSQKRLTLIRLHPSMSLKTSKVDIIFERWIILPTIAPGAWKSRRFSETLFVEPA